ncbi:hypothetical protein MRS44_007405 [Fusarium solani]|uniref:uncharacterized protein n=1 Tax=Fusarium solani TaxID=169388 RepID=UPI0032C49D52|nr:hypothetical protein MRS44_007405 [Fusarium solani]
MSSETSSPHSVEIHVTPPHESSTPVSADARSDILRESVEIRGKRDGDASSLLQQNLVYGSEMDALLRAPAFKHQGMSSCPELSRRALGSPKSTPPSSNSPRRRRSPLYHSHPVTPRTFRSRPARNGDEERATRGGTGLKVLGRAGADDLGSDRTGGDSPVGRGGGYLGDIGPGPFEHYGKTTSREKRVSGRADTECLGNGMFNMVSYPRQLVCDLGR